MTTQPDGAAQRPDGDRLLSGIRVIEQGAFITGPYAAMLLADLGADVIKVEKPGTGDAFRSYDGSLYAPTFQAFNRNKRSITLDVHDPDDARVLDELVASADVYLHNFRSGVADRLGIGAERLMGLNPRLVYCAISGLGATGPYARRPAYDTVAQAYSGLLSMTLDPEAPRISGPAAADAVTGMYAAQGILAALVRRGIDGRGHLVEISMLEAMAHFLIEPYSSYFGTGRSPGPYTRAAVSQSYAMTCADGRVVALHLSSPPKFWLGLLDVLGLQHLADRPEFAQHVRRVENHEQLRVALQAVFATQPRDHWLALLEKHDVPHAPVLPLDEAVEDPQFDHLRLAVDAVHPEAGAVRTIRPAHVVDGRTETAVQAPPVLGEHNDEIRAELARRRSARASDEN